MHLAIFIVGHGVLLQALGHDVVGYHDGFALGCCIGHKVDNVKQLSRIASAIAQQGISFIHFHFALAQIDIFRDGSLQELEQEGVSYTYLTLRHMQEFYGEDTRLFFITGTDSFLKIDTWRNAPELLTKYSYIIGTRPGYRQDEYREARQRITDAFGTEVISMHKTELDISATQIREMVAAGKPIDDLVPPEVDRYIKEHGLYRV